MQFSNVKFTLHFGKLAKKNQFGNQEKKYIFTKTACSVFLIEFKLEEKSKWLG